MASTLAFEYFKIGNGVTASYVVQTLLFLNAIYKEPKLLALFCKSRQKARSLTWFIARIYLGVILSCAAFEFWLNYASQPEAGHIAGLASSLVAAVGRCCLISILAWGCSQLIKNLKDESTVLIPCLIHFDWPLRDDDKQWFEDFSIQASMVSGWFGHD